MQTKTRFSRYAGAVALATAFGSIALTGTAHAQTQGIVFTGPDQQGGNGVAGSNSANGYVFNVGASPVQVVSLGAQNYIPSNPGGTSITKGVAIYTITGTQLASATVLITNNNTPPTFAGALQYTFSPITPITLSANTSYFIEADNNSFPGKATAFTTDPRITLDTNNAYFGFGSNSATTYVGPGSGQGNNSGFAPGFTGPNFQLAAAPEPSQSAAMTLGVLGLGLLALRARKRSLGS